MTPENTEQPSNHMMDSGGQRPYLETEGSLDPRAGDVYSGPPYSDPISDLQYHVRVLSHRLWAEKREKEILLSSGPASSSTEKKTPLVQDSVYHSNRIEIYGHELTLRQSTNDTPIISQEEQMDWDYAADGGELDREFTMFEDTPRDSSLVTETEELLLPPWDQPDAPSTPSTSALASMEVWNPDLDGDYQVEARWNLEEWDDWRFKVPETREDMESVQQALEMSRMDFWIKNPHGTYPDDLSQYKGESYGSQHRRLQHMFCTIWREFDTEPAAGLYRLPPWMFGFEPCYWRPSNWGIDKRSNVYNQGLAEMAAEKKEKGLQLVCYQDWKTRLEEQVRAATVADSAPLALYTDS